MKWAASHCYWNTGCTGSRSQPPRLPRPPPPLWSVCGRSWSSAVIGYMDMWLVVVVVVVGGARGPRRTVGSRGSCCCCCCSRSPL